MSITKLIKEQTKLFTDLDKRFTEKVTPQNYKSRIKAVTEGQEKRIAARIKSLEKQKASAVARFDAAIKTEREALKEIEAHRVNLNPQQDDKGGVRGTKRGPAKPSRASTVRTTRSGAKPTTARGKSKPAKKK